MGAFDMSENIFSYVLTNGSITIVKEWGVRAICVKLISGAGSVLGSMKLGALSSAAVPLVVNDPVTISVDESNYIDGLTIEAAAGVINIFARK